MVNGDGDAKDDLWKWCLRNNQLKVKLIVKNIEILAHINTLIIRRFFVLEMHML